MLSLTHGMDLITWRWLIMNPLNVFLNYMSLLSFWWLMCPLWSVDSYCLAERVIEYRRCSGCSCLMIQYIAQPWGGAYWIWGGEESHFYNIHMNGFILMEHMMLMEGWKIWRIWEIFDTGTSPIENSNEFLNGNSSTLLTQMQLGRKWKVWSLGLLG